MGFDKFTGRQTTRSNSVGFSQDNDPEPHHTTATEINKFLQSQDNGQTTGTDCQQEPPLIAQTKNVKFVTPAFQATAGRKKVNALEMQQNSQASASQYHDNPFRTSSPTQARSQQSYFNNSFPKVGSTGDNFPNQGNSFSYFDPNDERPIGGQRRYRQNLAANLQQQPHQHDGDLNLNQPQQPQGVARAAQSANNQDPNFMFMQTIQAMNEANNRNLQAVLAQTAEQNQKNLQSIVSSIQNLSTGTANRSESSSTGGNPINKMSAKDKITNVIRNLASESLSQGDMPAYTELTMVQILLEKKILQVSSGHEAAVREAFSLMEANDIPEPEQAFAYKMQQNIWLQDAINNNSSANAGNDNKPFSARGQQQKSGSVNNGCCSRYNNHGSCDNNNCTYKHACSHCWTISNGRWKNAHPKRDCQKLRAANQDMYSSASNGNSNNGANSAQTAYNSNNQRSPQDPVVANVLAAIANLGKQ